MGYQKEQAIPKALKINSDKQSTQLAKNLE